MQVKMDEENSVDLEKLDELLECPLCLEMCEDPKTLPCHHWYCAPCLERVVRNLPPEGWFPCPNCRTDVQIPLGGVQNFPAAFIINKLSEAIGRKKKSNAVQCSNHGQDCEMFCETCKQLVCVKCCVQEHKGHSKNHVEEIVDEHKDKLTQTLDTMKNQTKCCEKHLNTLNMTKTKCESEAVAKKEEIKIHGDKLIQKIHLAVVKMQQRIMAESAVTINRIEEAESTMNEELSKYSECAKDIETSLTEGSAAAMIEKSVNEHEAHMNLLGNEPARRDISKMSVILQLPDLEKISEETLLGPLHFSYSACIFQEEPAGALTEGATEIKVDLILFALKPVHFQDLPNTKSPLFLRTENL